MRSSIGDPISTKNFLILKTISLKDSQRKNSIKNKQNKKNGKKRKSRDHEKKTQIERSPTQRLKLQKSMNNRKRSIVKHQGLILTQSRNRGTLSQKFQSHRIRNNQSLNSK